MLLAPYLFFASIEAKGDVKVLMLGRDTAMASTLINPVV